MTTHFAEKGKICLKEILKKIINDKQSRPSVFSGIIDNGDFNTINQILSNHPKSKRGRKLPNICITYGEPYLYILSTLRGGNIHDFRYEPRRISIKKLISIIAKVLLTESSYDTLNRVVYVLP
jgi:hypothetical protein